MNFSDKQKLRDQAEARLSQNPRLEERLRLREEVLHELHVHQIELEMQNEELRRNQIALEESRDRYVDLYEFAPVGYLTLDRNGAVVEANLTAAALFGVERNRLYKRRIDVYVAAADRERWHRFFMACKTSMSADKRIVELAFETAKGPLRHGRLDCLNTIAEDGSRRLRVALIDIGELRLAQENLERQQAHLEQLVEERTARLAASEAMYRAVVEQNVVGIFIRERGGQGRFRYANAALASMLGRDGPEDLIGRTIFEFFAPEEHRKLEEIVQSQQNENQVHLAIQTVRSDGVPVALEIYGRTPPIFGEPISIGIVVDISRRYRAEAELRESELRQRLAIAASKIGLWDWDIVGEKVIYSREYKAQLGYAEDEIGQDFSEWSSRVHPDDLPSILAEKDRLLVGERENSLELEFRIRHRDGSWRWIYTRAELLRDESGRPCRMLGCHVDITERKRMEQELQDAARQQALLSRRLLEIQEEERRRLARELHDEIGQALTAVNINLQSASILAGPGKLLDSLGLCADSIGQAIKQVRRRSLELRPALLDDLGLIPAIEHHIERQAELGECAIEFRAAPLVERPPPNIEIACYRVMQESLTNALRHARPTRVRIDLAADGDRLRLRIRDDGRGFDVETARRRARSGGSFGLLSMEERVLLSGGGIEIVSAPDRGCEVRAWFPLREEVQ